MPLPLSISQRRGHARGAGGGGVLPPVDAVGVAALAAYGFRKLRTAYAGAAMNVTRVSDSATLDIGFDASGNFNVAAFNTFIGASSGTVHTWYDQSGNGYNLTVAATAPAINLTGINGGPTAVFTASNNRMQLTAGPSGSQPYTMATVAERTGAFTAVGGTLADWNSNDGIYFFSVANQVQLYATPTGSSGVNCNDGVAHSLIGVFNGASSTLTVDGATTSGLTVGAGTISGLIIGGGNGNLTGNVSEAIAWTSALSAPNIATLASNQASYWGRPTLAFNPADMTTFVALTNSNLTATAQSGASNVGVRTTRGYNASSGNSGKVFWELNIGAGTWGADTGYGLANLGAALSGVASNATGAVIYYATNWWYAGANHGVGVAPGNSGNNITIMIAVDLANHLMWAQASNNVGNWNVQTGSGGTNNPATGVGGLNYAPGGLDAMLYPCVVFTTNTDFPFTMNVNGPFVLTPPTGFTALGSA